jgi:hypothetical protein
MVRIYEVYCGERYIGRYRALTEKLAIEQAYMKTGSASAYTGNARHMYKAVVV